LIEKLKHQLEGYVVLVITPQPFQGCGGDSNSPGGTFCYKFIII